MQRCFSLSRMQEKGMAIGLALDFGEDGKGGWQVAIVKKSTSLRTKKRGKVPPRLETL